MTFAQYPPCCASLIDAQLSETTAAEIQKRLALAKQEEEDEEDEDEDESMGK